MLPHRAAPMKNPCQITGLTQSLSRSPIPRPLPHKAGKGEVLSGFCGGEAAAKPLERVPPPSLAGVGAVQVWQRNCCQISEPSRTTTPRRFVRACFNSMARPWSAMLTALLAQQVPWWLSSVANVRSVHRPDLRRWPIAEDRPSYDQVQGHRPEIARVAASAAVVAHDKHMKRRHYPRPPPALRLLI